MRPIAPVFFLIVSLFFSNCTFDKNIDSCRVFNEKINRLEQEHFQSITFEELNELLNSSKIAKRQKDFVSYYIVSYLRDRRLTQFIYQNNRQTDSVNVYSELLKSKMAETESESKAFVKHASELEPSNIYVLLEQLYLCRTDDEFNATLQKCELADSLNEIYLTEKVIRFRTLGDTLNYLRTLRIYRSHFKNYYSDLFVGCEKSIAGEIDSAIYFLQKSLEKRENVGALIQLSDIFFRHGNRRVSKEYNLMALALDSLNEDVLTLFAWQEFERRDTVKALRCFNKLLKIYPSTDNFKEFVIFNLSIRKFDVAERVFNDQIRVHVSEEEQAAYFLAFRAVRKVNSKILYAQMDSVKRVHGPFTLEFSNKICESVLQSMHY